MKAKAFYSLLKDNNPEIAIMSFDCQKNQVLPKVPDQSAYFSRQPYQYNCTVVVGNSKSPMTKDNTFIYQWNETEFLKGSNEIASIVYNCLCMQSFSSRVITVRLISDGCGGQNKNTIMMGMLC